MKVTEIRLDRSKSLGNYQNIKLGLSVVPEECECPLDVIDRVKMIVDWELNKEERETRYAAYKAQLESGETNGKTESITRWVNQFEKQRDAIAALGR